MRRLTLASSVALYWGGFSIPTTPRSSRFPIARTKHADATISRRLLTGLRGLAGNNRPAPRWIRHRCETDGDRGYFLASSWSSIHVVPSSQKAAVIRSRPRESPSASHAATSASARCSEMRRCWTNRLRTANAAGAINLIRRRHSLRLASGGPAGCSFRIAHTLLTDCSVQSGMGRRIHGRYSPVPRTNRHLVGPDVTHGQGTGLAYTEEVGGSSPSPPTMS